MWKSEHFGIELKINPNSKTIDALKKFIEVLETGQSGVQMRGGDK